MIRILQSYKNPRHIMLHIRERKLRRVDLSQLSDEDCLKLYFRTYLGYKLDLNNPQTFNEKIQWLKLYDRNPEYTKLVDKYLVRDFVKEKIGGDYLIPLIGVWDRPEDIDFSSLPNKFVLKCNHNSGKGMYICHDKSQLDINQVMAGLREGLNEDYYMRCREWPYKNVNRKIVCEEYISDKNDESGKGESNHLTDYKFMCFGGKVKCEFICVDRFEKTGIRINFYDPEWNLLPFTRHYPSTKKEVPPPVNLKKMIELAEILSEGIPFVRVDFYESDGRIYFGEMTFYPGSGFEEFTPFRWDRTLGDWIELPSKTYGD